MLQYTITIQRGINMKKHFIYIVLTRTNTIISKLIHNFTKDNYTHAAISLDKELNYMYSFGRKWAYNPFIGGFIHEHIDEGGYKFSKILPGVIIELQVTEDQYYRANWLLNQFIYNSDYYKYNYLGLINNLMYKEICYENRFLCSEFVYHILNESGIADFKKARNLIRPEDFLQLEGKIIYEGDLRALKPQVSRKGHIIPYEFYIQAAKLNWFKN